MLVLLSALRGAIAGILLQDPINYSAGTQLGNNPPWTSPQTAITVSSGSLTYSNLADIAPAGNEIAVATGTAAISYRPLVSSATNGAVYLSFLISYSSISSSYYRAGLLQSGNLSPASANDPLDLVDNVNGSGYKLGVRSKGGTTAYVTNVMQLNAAYFIVMKYDFTNGLGSLWLNPQPGAPETPPQATCPSPAGIGVSDLTNLYVRCQSGGSFSMDTIRVGSTWAEVTPASESVASLLAFTIGPSNTVAGETLPPVTVQLQDQFGNNVASNNVPVTLTLNAGSFAGGNTTVNSDGNGQATFTNLVIHSAGSYVMTASGSGVGAGLAPDTSDLFAIAPAAIAFYTISVPAARSAGVAFPVTGAAFDAYTNPVAADSSTQVTLGTTGALLFDGNHNEIFGEPGDDVVTLSAGAFSVSALDNTPETITITATDSTGKTGSSSGITITDDRISMTLPGETFTPGAGNSGIPASQTAGVPFTVELNAVNGSNVVDTAFSGGKTVVFAGPGGSPSYPTNVIFSAGTGTAQITLTLTGPTSIIANESARAGIPSSIVSVQPGALDHFQFAPIATQVAGMPFNVVISAQDFWNNVISSFAGAVNLSTTAGTILPTNSAAFVSGVVTQSMAVAASGAAQTITATRVGGTESGTSGAFMVTSAPMGDQAAILSAFLDSFQVEKYWAKGVSVNWLTGASGGSGPNMTAGTSTHCSAFAPAVAELLGVYLLHPPDASDLSLANRQADWLRTNQSGWFPIPLMTDAQHMVNTGALVVASLKATSGSGHIAVLRPSSRSDASINQYGPEECQSGTYNFNSTNVSTGFNQHPGGFPNSIFYFGHGVNYPLPFSTINPVIQSCSISNSSVVAGTWTAVGRKYTLQWSTNFSNWTGLVAFTNSNNSSNFFTTNSLGDSTATNSSSRFYRLLAR